MNEEQFKDIPQEFYSFETNSPFTTCIECECNLMNKEYFIEKAFKTYPGFKAVDVIFELAICADCAETLRKTMSEESMVKMADFLQRRTNTSRRIQVMQEYPDDPGKWTEHCMVSGQSRTDVTEYQLYAHCQGTQLILDLMPYMISGSVLDEMSDLLSNKTLGEMDDFMGRHFGPPSMARDLPRRTILV